MAQADVDAAVVAGADRDRARGRGLLRFIPGFVYILGLYIIGKFAFPDPRAPLFDVLGYRVSWVEILLLGAAVVAMAEQVKVARPGVNNTSEVLMMGAIAIIQLLLFALGAAKVEALAMFDNTEFLILTVINLAQTAVAYQINSATLMRTIASA
jgi:hypothetical protein